jgi:hypothetical protein
VTLRDRKPSSNGSRGEFIFVAHFGDTHTDILTDIRTDGHTHSGYHITALFAGERGKKGVGPAKNGEFQFFASPWALKFLLPTDFDQIAHEGSPWDVPHHDSRTTRKRDRKTEILENNGKITCVDTPSYKIFFYQPISTKFRTTLFKLALRTFHIKIVKFPEKAIRQPRKRGKTGKNQVFAYPTALKFLFANRFHPNFIKQ